MPRISRIDTTFQPCNFLGSLSPVDTVLVTELNAILIGYKRSLPRRENYVGRCSSAARYRNIERYSRLYRRGAGNALPSRNLFGLSPSYFTRYNSLSDEQRLVNHVNHSRVLLFYFLFEFSNNEANSFRSIYTKTCIKVYDSVCSFIAVPKASTS